MKWDLSDGAPIWQQLLAQLTRRIATGAYPRGSRMPPVRELAAEAGVNPNTMQRALAQLEMDGLVTTNRTTGRTVTEDGEVLEATRRRLAGEAISDYLGGMALLGYSRQEAAELLTTWEETEQ